jgi:hypothetical protein
MIDDLINTDTTNMTQDELEAHVRETLDFIYCSFRTYKTHPNHKKESSAADDRVVVTTLKKLHQELIPNKTKFSWSQQDNHENFQHKFSLDIKRMSPILKHVGSSYERSYCIHNAFERFNPSTLASLTSSDPNTREFLRHVRVYSCMKGWNRSNDSILQSICHYYLNSKKHGYLQQTIHDFYSDEADYSSKSHNTHTSMIYKKDADCHNIKDHSGLIKDNRLYTHLIVNIVTSEKDNDETITISFLGDKTQLRGWWSEIQPTLKENIKEEYFDRCLKTSIDAEKRIAELENFSKVI